MEGIRPETLPMIGIVTRPPCRMLPAWRCDQARAITGQAILPRRQAA